MASSVTSAIAANGAVAPGAAYIEAGVWDIGVLGPEPHRVAIVTQYRDSSAQPLGRESGCRRLAGLGVSDEEKPLAVDGKAH